MVDMNFNFAGKEACHTLLKKGLQQLAVSGSPLQQEQLLAFIALIQKWNQHFNLTAIRDPIQMVSRHLLDSLTILKYLEGQRILDVGTGAGLPGIPLSILCPDRNFFLLDSSHKKQVFILQVVKSLSLKNVEPVHSQVQRYQPGQKFSTIITRAFAPIEQMIPLTAHLLADEGRFLAMMGKLQQEPQLPSGYQVDCTVPLHVPGENAQRHLVIIKRHHQ